MNGTIMAESLQNIYKRMGDALSREIYLDRLNYSITSDRSILDKMTDRVVRSRREWQSFLKVLEKKASGTPMYLFGAGIWGNILYNETRKLVPWMGVIDNQQGSRIMDGPEGMTLGKFVESCNGDEVIVISSYKHGRDMTGQLESAGISLDRIVDAGRVIHSLTEGAIYFDLKELKPKASGEYFVDAGGFDGMTTEGFLKWCGGNGYSYCFEFDNRNISSIERVLGGNRNCSIVPKALWSETTYLFARMEGNYASSVAQKAEEDGGHKIEAVALDDFLMNRPVTFVKMDIEGAELEALKGARHTIMGQRPKLAVSIYHKAEDIWTIPGLLLEYYPGYRFYLRHYSFSDYDTVLYAIP